MLNIFCGYWPSAQYDDSYVYKLCKALRKNLSVQHRFHCISPIVPERTRKYRGINWIESEHGWEGWWIKVQAFDPKYGDLGRIVLMDLDMVVTGSLDEMLSYDGSVICAMDFGGEKTEHLRWPSQTLMSFAPGTMTEVWERFMKEPGKWMAEGDRKRAPYFGDAILWKLFNGNVEYYQDHYPGQLVSNRIHCGTGLPDNARLVSFHGKPKPRETSIPWVVKNWHQL